MAFAVARRNAASSANRAAFEVGIVSHLHVPAWTAGIAAHGAPVLFCCFVVFQHCLQDERGEVTVLDFRYTFEPREIIVRDVDCGLVHQGHGRFLNGFERIIVLSSAPSRHKGFGLVL